MKTQPVKKALTFGQFVMAMYEARGKRRAGGFVRLAVNAHLVEFRARERFVISEPGPNKITIL